MVNIELFLHVTVDDGEVNFDNLSKDDLVIGLINGVEFHQVINMESDLYESAVEEIPDKLPDDAISIKFIASGFCHQEGQMTFPETGQWDFPPYWEVHIQLDGYDVIDGDKIVFKEVSSNE